MYDGIDALTHLLTSLHHSRGTDKVLGQQRCYVMGPVEPVWLIVCPCVSVWTLTGSLRFHHSWTSIITIVFRACRGRGSDRGLRLHCTPDPTDRPRSAPRRWAHVKFIGADVRHMLCRSAWLTYLTSIGRAFTNISDMCQSLGLGPTSSGVSHHNPSRHTTVTLG